MGTNYYLTTKPCECCGHNEETHIGKSSAGWAFALHVTDKIKSLEDWKILFDKFGSVITNEYGETITPTEMINRITKRQPQFLRHFGFNLVSHGEGSWDCLSGDFS